MTMIRWLYKRIIHKLDLSVEELQELKMRLTPENICKGPFVQGEKNCPNTTALAIKESRERFKVADEVKKILGNYGITSAELWLFYIIFDLPAMISEDFFRRALTKMKISIVELINLKQG